MIGGSVSTILQTMTLGSMISKKNGKRIGFLPHKPNGKDLAFLSELFEAGNLKPVIDKTYPLSETGAAVRCLGEGRVKGKLVITI